MPHALSTRSPLSARRARPGARLAPARPAWPRGSASPSPCSGAGCARSAPPRRSPVGQVREAHGRVRLVDVLAAGTRRAVGVDAQVLLVDLHLVDTSSRNGVTSTEAKRRLAAVLRVERRHAHEAVHAALGGQQPVGETSVHDERRRQQPGLLSLRRLVDLDGEAAAFGPPLVHAQQHLGPVLRVGAAGAGVDFAHRVELVVLAREERLQLERAEARPERVDRLDELGVEGGVTGAGGGRLRRTARAGRGRRRAWRGARRAGRGRR